MIVVNWARATSAGPKIVRTIIQLVAPATRQMIRAADRLRFRMMKRNPPKPRRFAHNRPPVRRFLSPNRPLPAAATHADSNQNEGCRQEIRERPRFFAERAALRRCAGDDRRVVA